MHPKVNIGDVSMFSISVGSNYILRPMLNHHENALFNEINWGEGWQLIFHSDLYSFAFQKKAEITSGYCGSRKGA